MDVLVNKKTNIDGQEVAYFVTAEVKEVPIVMVPGWPVSTVSLEPLANNLAPYFECYGVNLPGFGESGLDKEFKCTFDNYSVFLKKFIDRCVGKKRVHVFGYSAGGNLAIKFADQFPEMVERLIIFSAPYNGREHWEEDIKKRPNVGLAYKMLNGHKSCVSICNIATIKKMVFEYLFGEYYSRRYPKLQQMDKAYLKRLLESSCKLQARAAWELGKDISETDFSELAKNIKNETLIISPSSDEAVNPYWSKKLASEIMRHAKFYEIWGEDHTCGLTEPEMVAKKIVEFLGGEL